MKMCDELVVGKAIGSADGEGLIEFVTEEGVLCRLTTADARKIACAMLKACDEVEVESEVYRRHAKHAGDEEAMVEVEMFRERRRREMARGDAPRN